MLDINHPDTNNTFEAASIEDRIRAILVELRTSTDEESTIKRNEVVEHWIPKLRVLNVEKFGNQAGILATLDSLENVICNRSLEECWQEFYKLAEQPGENFGTWAI